MKHSGIIVAIGNKLSIEDLFTIVLGLEEAEQTMREKIAAQELEIAIQNNLTLAIQLSNVTLDSVIEYINTKLNKFNIRFNRQLGHSIKSERITTSTTRISYDENNFMEFKIETTIDHVKKIENLALICYGRSNGVEFKERCDPFFSDGIDKILFSKLNLYHLIYLNQK